MQFITGILHNKEEETEGKEKRMNKNLYAYTYFLIKTSAKEKKISSPE